MIIYLADRHMNIVATCSNNLPKGLKFQNDLKSEDVESGVATFSVDILYDEEDAVKTAQYCESGNYVIVYDDNEENGFYTIIEAENDRKEHRINIYAEDGGLDLLNEVVDAYTADAPHPIAFYVEKFSYDSGFEIGLNEVSDLNRTLSWTGQDTCTARILSVANSFDAEIGFSFTVKNMTITHKYINIYKKRGNENVAQLRLNTDIDNIIVKSSISDLTTCLIPSGGTPEGSEYPITLAGYSYDDGDIYINELGWIASRTALSKWSRYQWETYGSYGGHIVKYYSYDTTSQSELCNRSISYLKKYYDIIYNYEVDIAILPDNVRIGDTINIIDENGELYLNARVLKLETSSCDKTATATLGDFLIKSGGISEKVKMMAEQFKDYVVKQREQTYKTQQLAKSALTKANEASTTASNASKKADDAKANANDAINKSAEAINKSAEAITESKQAHQSAGEAKTSAETALTKIDSATADLKKAQDNINSLRSDISSTNKSLDDLAKEAGETKETLDGLNGDLQETKETLELSYAKKTDLSSTEASLKAEITKSATELSSSIERTYAGKSELTDIQGKLQSQITQNAEGLTSQSSKIDKLENDTADAQLKITAASEAALKAQGIANEAQTAADNAKTAADEAQTAADEAASKATSAQQKANEAKTTAEAANTRLASAESDLSAAKENLKNVTADVNATKEQVQAAQNAVTEAEKNVAKAMKDATDAQNVAKTAQTAADTAKTTANTAQDTANKAKANADEATKTANLAKDTANKAQETVAALTKRVTSAETNISQNSEAISTSASKITEIGNKLTNNYYSKTETDALLKVESDRVTTTVSRVETVEKKSLTSTVEEFYQSTSPTTLTGGTWSTTQPAWSQGKYIWRRFLITKGDGSTSYSPSANGVCISGNTGATGATGKGVKSSTVTYQGSTSGVTVPTGTWSSSIPSVAQGQYLWTKTLITYTDNTTSTSYSVSYISKNGNDGATGKVALQVKKNWVGIYTTVGTVASADVSVFNRTPVVGDIFANIDGSSNTGTWEVTSVADWLVSFKLLSYVNSKGNTGPKGDIGYSIVANVVRESRTLDWWNTYAVEGHTEPWNGTESTRNGCRIGDIFTVSGTDTSGNGHIAYFRSTTASGDLTGTSLNHVISKKGDTGSTGAKGAKGDKGDKGRGIASTIVTYQAWKDGITTPSGTWSTSPPTTTADKPYLWTKTVITYTDGTSSTGYSVGSTPEGISVGGRNLLKQYIRDGRQTIKISDTSIKLVGNGLDTYFCLKPWVSLTKGETYTISFDASGVPDGCKWSFGVALQESTFRFYISKNGRISATGQLAKSVNAGADLLIDDYIDRPSGAQNIILSNFKLEKGNKATDWTPAPEDVANVISAVDTKVTAVSTKATQLADKFNWLVKSGTSSTDFTLTDRTATLISQYINLNGLVTFSGLNSDTQSKITSAGNTANSALSKAGTAQSTANSANSLASTANSTANSAKSLADSINNSTEKRYKLKVDLSSSTYDVNKYYPVVLNGGIPSGGMYKYECNVQLNSGTKPSWSSHGGGFTVNLIAYMKANGWGTTDGNGYIEEAFCSYCNKMPAYITQFTHGSKVVFYLRGGGAYYLYSPVVNDTATIYTTKTNLSSSSYPWYVEPTTTPSNGYVIMTPSVIGNWCSANDETMINGGKIYTGSVTADKIAANAITADKIAVDAIKSKNYVANSAGSFLNLSNGSFDSKYLKWDSSGKITATSGTIAGINIESGRLYTSKESIVHHQTGDPVSSTDANRCYVLNTTEIYDTGYLKVTSDYTIHSQSAEDNNDLNGNIGTSIIRGGFLTIKHDIKGGGYTSIKGHTIIASSNNFGTTTISGGDITASNYYGSFQGYLHATGGWAGKQYFSGGEWIGWYDAQNGNRKGWIGHDGSANFQIYNGTGGYINLYGGPVRLDTQNVYMGWNTALHMDISGGETMLWTTTDSNNYRFRLNIYANPTGWGCEYHFIRHSDGSNSFRPGYDGGACLGTSNCRWSTVYSTSGSVSTSDMKQKDVINDYDFKARDFIMGLKPIAYRLNAKGANGKRIHMGFGAQPVYKLINNLELGDLSLVEAWKIREDSDIEEPYYGEKMDDKYLRWGMKYEELLAPLVALVQEQQIKIEKLEKIIGGN